MLHNTTENFRHALRVAGALATARDQQVHSAIILHVLLTVDPGVGGTVLRRLLAADAALPQVLAERYGTPPTVSASVPLPVQQPEVGRLLVRSRRCAARLGHSYHGTEHLLLALVTDIASDGASLLLTDAGLTFEQIESEVLRTIADG